MICSCHKIQRNSHMCVRPALCKIAKQEIPRLKEIRKELLIHIPISLITTQIEREVKQLDERDMSWKLGREDAMRKWTGHIWRIAWDYDTTERWSSFFLSTAFC